MTKKNHQFSYCFNTDILNKNLYNAKTGSEIIQEDINMRNKSYLHVK